MTNISKSNTDPPKSETVQIYAARELIGSKNFAKIILDQSEYFLKITKQNKLILTK